MNGPTTGLGFSLRRISSWLWFELQILRAIGDIRRWKPDVVMVSSLSLLTCLTGVLLKWMFRIPLIVEVRDIYPLTLVEVGGFKSWHPAVLIMGWIEKFAYRRADKIVSSLPNLDPHVKSRIGRAKPVTHLPMGYDPEFYVDVDPSEKAIISLREMESCGAKFSVGYVGTIGLANALEEPLDAFVSMAADTPEVHFWIVGDGPLLESFERKYGPSSNIHFLGRHVKTDLPHLLEKFDLVINPWMDKAIYQFGISPNKWIDYMYAAKPILVSYDGHPFLVEDEKIGWLIAPRNEAAFREAIINLYNSPRFEIERRGLNGKRYLHENLSYKVRAVRLNELLADLITGSHTD